MYVSALEDITPMIRTGVVCIECGLRVEVEPSTARVKLVTDSAMPPYGDFIPLELAMTTTCSVFEAIVIEGRKMNFCSPSIHEEFRDEIAPEEI
jgi:hypothetical protein